MTDTPSRPVDERIAAAACIFRDEVVTLPPPARHHTIIRHIGELHPEAPWPLVSGGEDQGFVTDAGRYVEREEAGRIAIAAGQTPALRWGPQLFSEDLW